MQLSPAPVSVVLNDARGAAAIPQSTKDRVFAAAEKLKYRPNFVAQSLRKQRTFTIGVVVPEVSEGHATLVMSGISVVGFDDILSAAFQNPSLATVRQPLQRMGEIAAELMVRRFEGASAAPETAAIVLEPELRYASPLDQLG